MIAVPNINSAPYAVVVGLDHIVGLQTARILAQRRVRVIGVVKDTKHFCCRTNVCEKILVTDFDGNNLIETLCSVGGELEKKAVLFPCTDTIVLLVSRHRHVLEPYYHITLPQPEVVEMLMDKLSFYKYAVKENLPVPQTYFIRGRHDAEEVARKIIYPCTIKPPLKTPLWEKHTIVKAYKPYNAQEFLHIYDQCSNWADVLIAQEWIPGTDTDLYSCNCYFNSKSEPIVTFTARKLRQWPPETGNTSLGIECRNDVVLNESLRFFQKLSYRGLGYLEMKRDSRTGKYYIIEPNIGRPTGRSALAEACGVELLYTMYCDNADLPLPKNITQHYVGVKWIYLRWDLQSALYYWRRGNLTIGEWWRSLRGSKTYAVFSWTDPLPFFDDIRDKIKSLLYFILKKLMGKGQSERQVTGEININSREGFLQSLTRRNILSIFYLLRPVIPRKMQIFLRRRLILKKRSMYSDVWPIDQNAGDSPDDWGGWPDQKQFALVLTHDVETAAGQEKSKDLIRLEEQLGFRSSFNFVPERYHVSPELRKHLTSRGFEVGVHGLYHDGKLYRSKNIFEERAKQVNKILGEWGSVGFRSPAMHHNLEWIHALNITYDASTFDTDPFEPQSDGVLTIFPFWVRPSNGRNGYVELPYTLPQDFTLFILMKETGTDIWKKKLDWIVKCGGMVLLNTHPDYMNFTGDNLGSEEYPAEYYSEFLEYIKQNYKDQYWHVLPREIALFWKQNPNRNEYSMPPSNLKVG